MTHTLRDRRLGTLLWVLLAVLCAIPVVVAVQRPLHGIAVLGAGIFGIAIVRYPIPALGALLFTAPFHSAILAAVQVRAGLPLGPLAYWKDAIIVVLFVRGFLHRLNQDRRPPIHNAGDNLLLFYCLTFLALAILSPSRPTIYPALGRYVEGPMVLLTIRYLRPNKRELWFLAAALLGAATLIAGGAIIEWVGPRLAFQRWYGATPPPTGEPFVIGSGYRSGSFIYDPLVLAFYLAGALPLALGVGLVRTRFRPVLLMAMGIIGVGLLTTITRSGYIGGGLGVIIVLALSVRNAAIRISLIGITMIVSGSTAYYYAAGGSETFLRTESNEIHRQRIERAFNLVVARPIGYGLGTTDRNVFRVSPKRDPGQIGATENTYLSRALEGGIHGLALYLITLFATAMRLRAARRQAIRLRDGAGRGLSSGAIGALIAVALSGLFLGVLELPVELILWTPAGIALARASLASGEWRPASQPVSA